MGGHAVDNVYLFNSVFETLNDRVDLGKHPARDDTLRDQRTGFLDGQG